MWLRSMNFSHLVWLMFKQLHSYGCWQFWDVSLLCKVSQLFLWCVFISSSFLFGKHMAFSGRFLVQNWPRWPDFLNKFMDGCLFYWELWSQEILTKFKFLVEPHFMYDSYRKEHHSTVFRTISSHTHNNNQYLTWWRTKVHWCLDDFSGSCW
jgi:hypothetical protein